MKMLRYLDVQNILDKNDLILQESGCVGSENERGNTYMKKIGIVTDSHSSISQGEAEKLGIFVLPMPFYIDGECFYESVTLSRELFFEKLAAGADITTSQPSPTAVMEIWDKALEQFEKILYLPISSGLSGSYETAMMLAKDEAYEGRVLVVDDGQVAAPLHQMVLDTLDMIEKGYEAEQIRDLLERAGDRMMIYIALQTLECLKKGGRVTPAAAALGSVFNIKPILKLQTGKLDSFKKCHGIVKAKKAAIEAMQAEIRDNFQDALNDGALHLLASSSGTDEENAAWVEEIKEAFPGVPLLYDNLSLGVSCHIGPGGMGIGCAVAPDYKRV